jgi:RimJ/RimL family protein N-acetyltransferase
MNARQIKCQKPDLAEYAMKVEPITLAGLHVRLEPLTQAHAEPLVNAAADGELWNTQVTIIPSREGVKDYIQFALDGLAQGNQLPFVIMRRSHVDTAATRDGAVARPLGRALRGQDEIVGSTRFYDIFPKDRKCAIGYTWLAKSAQRTPINTECKLLLLTHAFETWRCVRVELITDVLNEQSRAAILRLGAKQEGILRKHLILPSGRVRDSVFFSITDDEWPEVKQRLVSGLNPPAA